MRSIERGVLCFQKFFTSSFASFQISLTFAETSNTYKNPNFVFFRNLSLKRNFAPFARFFAFPFCQHFHAEIDKAKMNKLSGFAGNIVISVYKTGTFAALAYDLSSQLDIQPKEVQNVEFRGFFPLFKVCQNFVFLEF